MLWEPSGWSRLGLFLLGSLKNKKYLTPSHRQDGEKIDEKSEGLLFYLVGQLSPK